MGYRNLQQCVRDLAAAGRLLRIEEEIDPYLEAAEIHRRVHRSGGPALFFANVKGCRFPMVSNLFGTLERVRFLFRDTLEPLRRLMELGTRPDRLWREPARYWTAPWSALRMVPRRCRRGPILENQTTIRQLPHVQCWPMDGGAFVLLPVVYSEDIEQPGLMHSNLGMYRMQLSGGRYQPNREVGLHYQLHRGIGVHHAKAVQRRVPLQVNVFVGGAPAVSVAAVMPLPEGMSELTFAGILAGHRIPMICRRGRQPAGGGSHPAAQRGELPIYAEADFCIVGSLDPERLLPEGPFGDHLGYYSLAHEFPVFRVERVYHRGGAIWPFTVVGRPPQEDTVFGQLIHELAGPVVPALVPGVHAVHAVDAAGVHPLMLAIGSERYTPYQPRQRPAELLTQANAILGQGQMSLAKYLLIVDRQDDPHLDVRNVSAFFEHVLRRIDWARDLHFQTCTTIDTLDYSGSGLNEGSKLVLAAVGPPRRELPAAVEGDLRLPDGFRQPRVCLPGILAVAGPPCAAGEGSGEGAVEAFCAHYRVQDAINRFPWIVIVDDSDFVARRLDNFLWVAFTRTNPAADVHGIGSFVHQKHWGCRGSLVMDARSKPHHAPPLVEDPAVTKKVDALAARGGPLAKYL